MACKFQQCERASGSASQLTLDISRYPRYSNFETNRGNESAAIYFFFFERNSRSSAFQLRKEKEGLCTKHIDENTALTAITGDKRKTETALLKH
jgi:hypothetical protein